jgi:tetratricopeptide (TPR) repeat protein
MDLKALSAQAAQWKERLDQNPSDYEALRNLGIVYHDMAIRDSKACGKKAVRHLEQAHQKKPDDSVVLCYLGSSYTILAKDASDLSQQSKDVNKGIETMDKAVNKDPDNLTVRLIRANNSKGLPRFLNRRSTAYEDFEHVADLFEKGLKVPSQLKASVYQSLADLYKEDGNPAEAKKYQTKADTVQKEK